MLYKKIEKIFSFLRFQVISILEGGRTIFIKKLRSFLKVLLSVLFLPAVFFMRLIRPFVLIRLGILRSDRIGAYTMLAELYLCEKDAGLHPKHSFDLFSNYPVINPIVCNRQLEKMLSRTLHISRLTPYLYMSNYFLPGYKRHIVPESEHGRDIHGLFERFPAHLSFTDEEEERGRAELKEIGIPDGAKFICFHARDSAYLNSRYPSADHYWVHHHDYRDSNIKNYLPAAEELVKRGYFAIRMGAVVKNKLDSENPHIIDYASKYRTDFMDIYLSAKCHFFISSGTGIDSVAEIFRVPIVFVNFMTLPSIHSWMHNHLIMVKKIWLRKEQRFMTFQEILESGVGLFYETGRYLHRGIALDDIVENSPEDITAIAVEMDERLKGTWQTTEEDEELQKRFWSIFNPNRFPFPMHGAYNSRIGAEFLRKNKDLLK